jgi:transposase-like protein
MRAYSTDLKERLVRAVAEGQPMREAARRYNVAVTTVKRAVVQQRETGSDGFAGAQAHSRLPAPYWTRAGGDPAGAAASGAGCDRLGALRVVGGARGGARGAAAE